MSPRPADPRIGPALIDAAARLLATEGPGALTTRRVAAEVGVSTIAVYTHFEGLDDLRRAVRLGWFARLAERLASVRSTADPVSDLGAQGWAYLSVALENEHMFRAMFLEPVEDAAVASAALDAMAGLERTVRRCIAAGRMGPGEAPERALQIWMTGTGVLVAFLTGFVTRGMAAEQFFETSAQLLIAFGDDPRAARASLARGRRRMERAEGPVV